MSWRSPRAADEHPLEALYAARDAAQHAAVQTRYVGILSGERGSYETVLDDLLVALGELSAQYRITFPAGAAAGRATGTSEQPQALSALLRSLPDQLAQACGDESAVLGGHGGTASPTGHRLSDSADHCRVMMTPRGPAPGTQ